MHEVSVLFCFCFLAVRPSKLCMSRVHAHPIPCMQPHTHARSRRHGGVLSAALDTCTQQSLYTTPVRASYNNFPCLLYLFRVMRKKEVVGPMEAIYRPRLVKRRLSLCGEEAEKKADRPQSQSIPPTPSSPTTAHTPGLPHTPPIPIHIKLTHPLPQP
jgi:hypothetical protein